MFLRPVAPSIVRLLGAGLDCSRRLTRGLSSDEGSAVTVTAIRATEHRELSPRLAIGAWAGPASGTAADIDCRIASRDVA